MRKLLVALAVISAFTLARPSFARSTFDPDEIEQAITETLAMLSPSGPPAEDADLSDADKQEIVDSLGELIAEQKPAPYNAVIGHLVADYRQHPDHRPALEAIIDSAYQHVLPELRNDRESHPVITVIDRVFDVWTIAYTVEFGRGILRAVTSAEGLEGIEKFKYVVSSVKDDMRLRMPKTYKAVLAAGLGIGFAEVIYDYLATKKLDPHQLLEETQGEIVRDLGQKMADDRKELKGYLDLETRNPSQFQAQLKTIRDRVNAITDQLKGAAQEVTHLLNAAPHFTGQLQPVTLDIQDIQLLLPRLSADTDRLDTELP